MEEPGVHGRYETDVMNKYGDVDEVEAKARPVEMIREAKCRGQVEASSPSVRFNSMKGGEHS
jgi:hypothetical protein